MLEILFLGFAGAAFFTMLHLLGTPTSPRAKLLRVIHRAGGGIAVLLYIVIAVLCIRDLRAGEGLSSLMAVRFSFGSLFAPMILMKIVIVEKYPELRNKLFGIGTVVFTVVVVVFFTSVFSNLMEKDLPGPADTETRMSLDLGLAKDLFVVKCAKCHRLDRPLSARMTETEWQITVERMREKDPSWISESEAVKITSFLVSFGE